MTVTINGTTGIDKVQDGVVTSDSIANGAVTPTDLSTGKPSWDSSGNLLFNSGYGSVATAYGCRAWVNFDGTSASIGAGRASGNVSSITDNGVGRYAVNFATNLVDANYAVNITMSSDGTNAITPAPGLFMSNYAVSNALTAPTVSTFVFSYSVARDSTYTCVSVFR